MVVGAVVVAEGPKVAGRYRVGAAAQPLASGVRKGADSNWLPVGGHT